MKIGSIFITVLLIVTIFSCRRSLDKKNLVNYSYIINGKDDSEYLSAGTGSIIHYVDKYYLITNFHVLTGKDVSTGKKFPVLKDTNTEVSIPFRPKDNTKNAIVSIYRLFDSTGNANFDTFLLDSINMDISAMPINLPENSSVSFFEEGDLDLSLDYEPLANLMIFGFANGEFVNGWQPKGLEAHGIKNLAPGPFGFNPFVFIDRSPIFGMSGSPIYILDSKGRIKVISIVTNIIDDDPVIKGRSVFIKFALDLVKKMYLENRSAVNGKLYRRN